MTHASVVDGDGIYRRHKYGALWDEYCRRVPYVLVPQDGLFVAQVFDKEPLFSNTFFVKHSSLVGPVLPASLVPHADAAQKYKPIHLSRLLTPVVLYTPVRHDCM
eukprot:9499117-Pyramimonas_sp.AAC.1